MTGTPETQAEFNTRMAQGYAERDAAPQPTAADVKLAQAVGFIESAQDQAARARRAVIAAGEDPTGLERILRDLDRELTWLRG